MIAEVRIYTINRNEMDPFLKQFNEKVAPLHARVGINITFMSVNRPQNEFIWVRTYVDEADRDAKGEAFREIRQVEIPDIAINIAKMEVRTVEVLPIPGARG